MKRWILVCALALFAVCAVSCAPQEQQIQPLSLEYRGIALTVGMSEQQALTALGNDYTLSESESCAGEGLDRMYTYPSLRLYVFASADGQATVTSASYTDDGAITSDGLHIGCTAEQVVSALGEPDEQSETRLCYYAKDDVLTFTVRDGRVSGIVLSEQ
ncbi:MAG: hypothetical protein IIX15_03980 [Clostridia bacterium]|nr:hypothetical protein [Clostridia bacterium]